MRDSYSKKAINIIKEDGVGVFLNRSGKYALYKSTEFKNEILWSKYFSYQDKFNFQTKKNSLLNNILYEIPADPHKKIVIKPSDIDYRIKFHPEKHGTVIPLPKNGGIGQIRGGDWDSNKCKERIENNKVLNAFKKRFVFGEEWEETEYYKYIHNKSSDDFLEKKEYDSANKYLKDRFRKYDSFYNDVKNNGYEWGHTGECMDPKQTQPVRDQLEVLVTIDRYGDIHFWEGNHRFAIARILNLEIPAHVVCRHKDWQDTRDKIYNNKTAISNEGLDSHPDLQDVFETYRQ